MIFDQGEYQKLVDQAVQCSKEFVSEEALTTFQGHITDKLNYFEPTIMVYGTYNSGKSTLINALFGKDEMAKTGDYPETSEVHGYQYKGYTIYDTPGVNAPIAHEEVTMEHLKKCEVILFVLSNNGSFEDENVYLRISDIVKTGKPLLIVLNNKKNSDPDSKETIHEIDKINLNLSKIGDRAGIKNIEEKVSLVMVDARTALEGKVEDEQELIDESRILQLEESIAQLLNEAGNTVVLNTLNAYMRDFIEKVISQIDMKIANPELQRVEMLLTSLEKLKVKSEIKVKNMIHTDINRLESGLREKLLAGSQEGEVHQYLEDSLNGITSRIESTFEQVSSKLREKIEGFSESMQAIHIEYGSTDIENNQNIQNDASNLLEDTIKNSLKNKKLVTQVTKEALLQLRELKVLFKGKWEKTLGAYAGKVATVVNILVGAYEIYQAYQSHEDQITAQRQHVLSAKNKSEEIANHLKHDLCHSVDEISTSLFHGLIDNFRKMSLSLDENNQNLLNNKNSLQRILAQLS
ncbi:MAG: GTPase [Mariprofundaceae bacterium]|nr:GTPase [Mariprofundaceae bacterium]